MGNAIEGMCCNLAWEANLCHRGVERCERSHFDATAAFCEGKVAVNFAGLDANAFAVMTISRARCFRPTRLGVLGKQILKLMFREERADQRRDVECAQRE